MSVYRFFYFGGYFTDLRAEFSIAIVDDEKRS